MIFAYPAFRPFRGQLSKIDTTLRMQVRRVVPHTPQRQVCGRCQGHRGTGVRIKLAWPPDRR